MSQILKYILMFVFEEDSFDRRIAAELEFAGKTLGNIQINYIPVI